MFGGRRLTKVSANCDEHPKVKLETRPDGSRTLPIRAPFERRIVGCTSNPRLPLPLAGTSETISNVPRGHPEAHARKGFMRRFASASLSKRKNEDQEKRDSHQNHARLGSGTTRVKDGTQTATATGAVGALPRPIHVWSST